MEWDVHGPIHYVNQYNPIGYTAAITKWAFGEKQYSVRLGQVHALSDYGKEIYKVGFLEGRSNPKIKQLEWDVHGPIHYVNQYNPIGYTAAITKWAFGEKQYSVRLGLNDSNSIKIFNTLEEAKDFVQQDFEKRVKECLITE